jgi:O-antigen/teichoic acid export membrane protein
MYASVYDLIYKLAALGCFPILLSKHPAIVEAWNTHAIHDAVRIIKKSLFLEAFVLLFMLAGGILIGEWLIHALLEITVPDYYLISIPLIVSSVLWQMALLIHKPLEMKHKTARMITYILLSLALNFLLNVLFIPRFGVTASAFSTLISTFFYAGLSALTASKLIKSTK